MIKDLHNLLTTKMIISLDRYVLLCLKNILKMEKKSCLLELKMIAYWLDIMKFGTKLKRF